MLGALGAAKGWFSPLLGQIFPGNAVSPSPAALLCWAFCLPPREPIGPAGLCAQGLGWSCRCGCWQAARPLISPSAALGLSCTWPAIPAALGLWVGQLASAPGVHPPEVSGVGTPLGFHVWAPSPLIWVRATGLQVSTVAAFLEFTVQGLKGEGHQRLRLLPRVL